MNTINFDIDIDDSVRRERLFNGQVFVFSPRPSSLAFVKFARELLQEAFAPLEPRQAQFSLPVEEFVKIASAVKPHFIHHPTSKQLLKGILEELQCDLNQTYMDVPRMKIVTHGGYLTSGIGYLYHPHRDTWYAAPACQQNWWIPIYDIESESSMAFHPYYWNNPVLNGSAEFDYDDYVNFGRKNAAQHIKTDTRKQPRPEEPFQNDPHLRLVCKAGGIILFSGAQMHSTIPNTSGLTRFSIDFRTVHLADVLAKQGAPNVDTAASGVNVALQDFRRAFDLERLPEEVTGQYQATVANS